MAVRYGENESEAPRWADHLAMNGRIVRSHFGIRFRPVAKWKKLSLSQMIRLSATLIHFSQLFQLIEFSIFCLKKKFLLQTNENFFKVNSFKFRKKIWSIPSNWSEIFFSTKKCNLERKDNKWMKKRNEKKRKVRDGRRLCGCPTHFFFFGWKYFFFPWNFTFRVRKKKLNLPNILNDWTFRWKKIRIFFFSKPNFDSFQNKMQIGAGQWTRSMSFDTQQKNSFAYSNKGLVKAGQSNFT